MDEENVNSSLNIWIFISVAVVLCGGIGWFLLDTEPAQETVASVAPLAETMAEPEPVSVAEVAELVTEEDLAVETPDSELEADLRKAQIAAAAEIYAEPADQSALYYYGRVLEREPGHEVANAELDAVLGQLQIVVDGQLAEERLQDAYRLAGLVAAVRPGHAIVETVQQDLDRRASELVEQAMQDARAGNNSRALATVEQAESLPGQNSEYYEAIRESIADVDQSLRDAARRRAERERAAYVASANQWVEDTRAAIAAGNLVAPAGTSARDLFLSRSVEDEYQSELRSELAAAFVAGVEAAVNASDFDLADALLAAAPDVGVPDEAVTALRNQTDERYAADKAKTLLAVNELVRRKNAAARYPRRAVERGISGWVEVEFTVTENGSTSDIRIANADPSGVFDSAVISAVEQWEFEPRVVRGRTIEQRTVARMVFNLE